MPIDRLQSSQSSSPSSCTFDGAQTVARTRYAHAATGTHLGPTRCLHQCHWPRAHAHQQPPRAPMPTLMFSLMRLNPPQHIISNTHPDPNEHCIGHQTTHNGHANHDSTRARTRSVTLRRLSRGQGKRSGALCVLKGGVEWAFKEMHRGLHDMCVHVSCPFNKLKLPGH
jgi:hypothetical protein